MKGHIVYIYRLKKNRYLTRLISFLLLIQSILREALWGVTQRKRIKAGVLFSNVKTSFGLYAILGTIWVQQLCNYINKIQNRIKMLMYGKEASNRKQEIDRQHYTIPNQRPKDKHCGKI